MADERYDSSYYGNEVDEAVRRALEGGALDVEIEGKTDKVAGATAGNLAALDASGNLEDSGILASSVALKSEVQNITPKRTASNDPASSSFSVLCDTAIAGEAKPKLYGKSVAINQLVQNGDFSDGTTGWNVINYPCSLTVSGDVITVTGDATYKRVSFGHKRDYIANHTYFSVCYVKLNDAVSFNTVSLFVYTTNSTTAQTSYTASTSAYTEIAHIWTPTANITQKNFEIFRNTDGTNIASVLAKNFMVIDLTAIGFTSAETASVSALKAAWLKKFGYPLPQYIDYSAGSIVSNNATYLMHGRNIWDGAYEANKNIDLTTGEIVSGTFFTTGFMPVSPNTAYYYHGIACRPHYYDANRNYIGTLEGGFIYGNTAQTTPSNCRYIVVMSAVTPEDALCINLSDASFNGQYEASFNGGSVTADSLNGIGTALDSQDAEGQEVRKVRIDDMGDIEWTESSTPHVFIGMVPSIQPAADYSNVRVICSGFVGVAGTSPDALPNMCICQRPHASLTQIYARDDSQTYAGQFKTAVAGKKIAYILATPTTSTTSAASLTTQAGYNSLDPVDGDVQSGDAECEYSLDIVAYVDKKFADLQ